MWIFKFKGDVYHQNQQVVLVSSQTWITFQQIKGSWDIERKYNHPHGRFLSHLQAQLDFCVIKRILGESQPFPWGSALLTPMRL